MSEKEQAIRILNTVPEYKIKYVLAFLQGLAADEDADDEFCQNMLAEYEADTDPEKTVTFSLEDCKKEWGIA